MTVYYVSNQEKNDNFQIVTVVVNNTDMCDVYDVCDVSAYKVNYIVVQILFTTLRNKRSLEEKNT